MPTPRLRPMTVADIAPAVAAIIDDDWHDRRAWFDFAVGHPRCRVFVAEVDDTVVGTGVATLNGPVAWIGTIWVRSTHRGMGLGRLLTQATIDAAEDAGCRTLVLVATDQGRPLYERMGFEVQTWYRILQAPGLADDPDAVTPAPPVAGRSVRAFRSDDLGVMATLDRAATGEDRAHLLAAFATPESTRVVVDADDRPDGFLVRAPWGGGATIAPVVDDAMAILHVRRLATSSAGRVRCGILLEHEAGAAALEAGGWVEGWRAPRLVRGDPLDWDPTAIWGQFNHAIG